MTSHLQAATVDTAVCVLGRAKVLATRTLWPLVTRGPELTQAPRLRRAQSRPPYGRSPVEALASEGDPASSGVQLALLVTDLQGFTPMVERLGDRKARVVIREHNMLLRERLRAHGGAEVFHTGDGVLACFRTARDAVTCALAIQSALAARNAASTGPDLRVRIGIHWGHTLVEENRLFGAAVLAAVRICDCCQPGHILASRSIHATVPELQGAFVSRGHHLLKGFQEHLELFEVFTAVPGAARCPSATLLGPEASEL